MDLVSELMRSVGVMPAYLAQGTFPKPWGIDYPTMRGAAFHLVIRGTSWLRSAQLPAPIQLEVGDLALVTGQLAYQLVSDPTTPAKPIWEALTTARRGPPPEVEAANTTSLVCGIYRFAVEPIHPFLPNCRH